MADRSWKAWERRTAKWFGGKRRGPVLGMLHPNDVIVDGWSIECKLLARPSFGEMLAAAIQAENAKEHSDDIAVAIVKRKHDLDENALVIMRKQEFLDHFVGGRDG